jgi:predicted nucleotidyltransferase
MGIQLKKGQEISGFPALTIRNLLRDIADRRFTKEWLSEKGFGDQTDRLLEALLQAGYIELDNDIRVAADPRPFYKITDPGRSMMRATGARRVQRATAQQALEDFMARVKEVNENPRFIVKVTEVVVFGSYLSDYDTLGDLDIACNYENKFIHLGQTEFAKKLEEHFDASGRRSRGIADLFWPWEEVRLFLKNKKRTISLHSVDEVEAMLRRSPDFRCRVLLGDEEQIKNRSRSKS